MNTRLQQFLSAENLTQSQFADSIGVARASISHILAGRNKPGFEFVESLARRYPALNLEWFITGKGKMYKTGPDAVENHLPDLFDDSPLPEPVYPDRDAFIESSAVDKQTKTPNNERTIKKVLLFYSDGSFEEFTNK